MGVRCTHQSLVTLLLAESLERPELSKPTGTESRRRLTSRQDKIYETRIEHFRLRHYGQKKPYNAYVGTARRRVEQHSPRLQPERAAMSLRSQNHN